jgi:hypothetical protein
LLNKGLLYILFMPIQTTVTHWKRAAKYNNTYNTRHNIRKTVGSSNTPLSHNI